MCHICVKDRDDPIHNLSDLGRVPGIVAEQPTDLMPRHDEAPAEKGDTVYMEIGALELTIYVDCSRESLVKLQDFVKNLIAQRS